MLFGVLEIQLDDPFGVLVEPRLAFLEYFLGLVQPTFRFKLGVFIELQDHQGRKHGFVVIAQKLIFAIVGDSLEKFHAEVVDIVCLIARLQHLPVLSSIVRRILQYLLGLVHKDLACHWI